MHPILETVTQGADEFVALRRDIHRHPELGYQEFRTSDLVAQCLTQWGYEVERAWAAPAWSASCAGARALGLRADMDALPIQEATGLEHASCNEGIMHACGRPHRHAAGGGASSGQAWRVRRHAEPDLPARRGRTGAASA